MNSANLVGISLMKKIANLRHLFPMLSEGNIFLILHFMSASVLSTNTIFSTINVLNFLEYIFPDVPPAWTKRKHTVTPQLLSKTVSGHNTHFSRACYLFLRWKVIWHSEVKTELNSGYIFASLYVNQKNRVGWWDVHFFVPKKLDKGPKLSCSYQWQMIFGKLLLFFPHLFCSGNLVAYVYQVLNEYQHYNSLEKKSGFHWKWVCTYTGGVKAGKIKLIIF